MPIKHTTKVLILSVGPVPVTPKSKVEGGGLRSWGLAKGLLNNGLEITIAIPENYELEVEKTEDGISIVHWSFSNLKRLLDEHDAIYALYSRADLMQFVTEHIATEKQLIVDLYVPIYIESLARKLRRDKSEFQEHLNTRSLWNTAFPRGDYFLCANETQKHFYTGILGAFGRINPINYGKERILNTLPYGIHSDPLKHDKQVCKGKLINEDDFMVLWFGGLYPWFDIKPLLHSIKKLSNEHPKIKLVILGGRNPFVAEAEFTEQYDYAVSFAKENELLEKNIFFVDWIPYEVRNNWYLESDVVINLHHKTEETEYSWRTRVIDYLWGELPILTTGGDEASEYLAKKGCAIILNNNSSEEIEDHIKYLHANKNALGLMRQNIQLLKPEFYWENLCQDLATFIKSGQVSIDREFAHHNNIETEAPLSNKNELPRKTKNRNNLSLSLKIIRERGLLEFARKTKNYLLRKFR